MARGAGPRFALATRLGTPALHAAALAAYHMGLTHIIPSSTLLGGQLGSRDGMVSHTCWCMLAATCWVSSMGKAWARSEAEAAWLRNV